MSNQLVKLILELGTKVGSSVLKAYTKVVKNSGGAAAGGSAGGGKQSEAYQKMKENMGMLAGKPMTRSEAMEILAISDDASASEPDSQDHADETLDPQLIMKRFDTLIEKN